MPEQEQSGKNCLTLRKIKTDFFKHGGDCLESPCFLNTDSENHMDV